MKRRKVNRKHGPVQWLRAEYVKGKEITLGISRKVLKQIRGIVEEAKVVRPLDRYIVSAYRYTKHSQELLEYVIGTCPQGSQPRAKQLAHIPLIRKKQVTVAQPSNKLDSTTHRHVVTVKSQKTNVPVPPSTGVNSCPNARESQPKSHVKPNKISPAKDNIADVNAPSGQTLTMAPPVRADDQILPHIRWVPIGKSNCYLDLEKSQSNAIYKIAVDLLKNTNFFRAFTASSTIPSIYIQQFWDTILYDKKAGCYKCQLDEQWFDLTKETLREALQITPILWGSVTRTNIDYAERIWEEFTQSIHTFIEDKRNLSRHTSGKKRATLIVIPSIRFTKMIIHHLQRKHRFHPRLDSPLHLSNEEPVLGYLKFNAKGTKSEVFGMPIPDSLIIVEIQQATYYQEYLAKAKKTTDKPAKAKRIKHSFSRKTRQPRSSPKSVGASEAEEVPAEEPQVADKDVDYQKAVEESMKDAYSLPKGPLPPVVIKEPESGKYQPLPEVPAKGKAKVTEDRVAHNLLSLQKHKKTSPADQYIFQRRVSEPTGSSGHDESPYALLGQSDNKEESEKVVLGAEEGGQDEDQAGPHPDAQAKDHTGSDAGAQADGQARSNLDETSEGQAGSNPDETSKGQAGPDPGDAEAKVQSISSPVVHAGSDREHMDLDVANVSPQPSTKQLDEGFTATVYPNVQENLKLAVKELVLLEEPASSSGTLSSLQHLSRDFSFGDQFFSDKLSDADKNAETEVESMVNVTIQQALSSISLMTSPIIDLTSRPDTTEAMMVKCIGELEHILADLIQVNKNIEERLDKHGARLYTLEQLDIPQQVSIVVSEVVMDAVDWAMQAPLCNHFRDLPEADMKEIIHQRMWESDSYKSHEDHMQLFEALKKSMNRDHSKELAQDLVEARKKKKKSRESPKTPPGSPSHQPPPPSLPAGPSEASGAPRASGSAQMPPSPPPHSSTIKKVRPKALLHQVHQKMDEDMAPDEQAQSSDDEDIKSAHIPTVNLRQGWWKPFKEERPTTPEPTWSIRSSDVPVPTNNWASALASNYSPPPEDSLLTQTDDIAIFIDRVDDPILRHNVSKPLPLGGPPGQVTIQSDFFFNKDLEYLRYGSKSRRPALSISKKKATYYPDAGLEQMVPYQFWIEEECKYDIATMYGISHWWFQRQRFYIDRHTSEGDHSAVRTHIRILSVVRIEVFSMYGYDYMKKIVLHRADLNEHVIAERDFKYLYPSDFEDLYLLNLQGHLNHLPPKDKKILTTAVNQWTRQLVIRQRVEDFQLGIESYQTQLNLTKPQWTATGFEYKHDYTVIESPMAVIFRDKYGVQMMMCFNEIHKFSDGTLLQIDEALDYRVKEFRINRLNPGLNTSFWTRKDVDRCNTFMFAIQRRLRTRRIFSNLESFVGGCVREGDYRLLRRTD
nr:hypothetical protein [Tanacetum cinerariifolium]